jgi:hypothetical protein
MTSEAQKKLADRVQQNRMIADANRIDERTGVVSINWLSAVFRMDTKAVVKRLSSCPPIKALPADGRTGRLYDLATAARYLVTPAMDTEDFLKVLNRNDLPPALQTQFWDAMMKRQRWEKEAGQLWPSDRVIAVLSEVFQTLKFTSQLWVDSLEREVEVTGPQRKVLQKLVDSLMQEIHDTLVEKAETGLNGPQKDDLPALMGSPKNVVIEEDDDFSDVI